MYLYSPFQSKKFLLLFSHNKFTWAEQTGKHCNEFPAENERKLYACVRDVSLKPFGNFAMGFARIGGEVVTVSGQYGSDGLPRNYDKLTERAKSLLVEVPTEVSEIFWKSTNDSEWSTMQAWALENIKQLRPTKK